MTLLRAAAAALAAVVLAAPGLSGAAGAGPDPDDAELLVLDEAARERWQGDLRALLGDLEAARERREQALLTYKAVRHRRRERGEPKAAAERELAESKADLDKVKTRLEDFYERARRAGVPPGWLREVQWEWEGSARTSRDDGAHPLESAATSTGEPLDDPATATDDPLEDPAAPASPGER